MIRILNKSDIPSITKLLNDSMEYDKIFFDGLVNEKIFGDERYDLQSTLVEEQNGKIIGFINGVYEKREKRSRGWIKLLAVHPEHRLKSVGSNLIKEVENHFKKLGIEYITIMDSAPNYYMPGLDFRYTEGNCFLLKNGYEKTGENINLIADIGPGQFNVDSDIKRLNKDGVIIKRADKNNKEAVIKFLTQAFPSWLGEVNETFKNNLVSLYISIIDDKVVGFSAYDGNNRGIGWFGPMGVLPVTRGKGIGAILCELCLRDIALQGHKQSIIPWVGPVRFYSKVCNSRIDRLFWTYRKNLK